VVAFTIIAFLTGMFLLAFVAIVSETVWVIALVGVTHILASIALGVLVVRQLGSETYDDEEDTVV